MRLEACGDGQTTTLNNIGRRCYLLVGVAVLVEVAPDRNSPFSAELTFVERDGRPAAGRR
jgi:hypothetical protein